jgi:hypothetical protein
MQIVMILFAIGFLVWAFERHGMAVSFWAIAVFVMFRLS